MSRTNRIDSRETRATDGARLPAWVERAQRNALPAVDRTASLKVATSKRAVLDILADASAGRA
jgi:hypothetical protein